MQFPKTILFRIALILLLFYVATTSVAVLSFISNEVNQYAVSDIIKAKQDDIISLSTVDEYIRHLVSQSDILATKIDNAMASEDTQGDEIYESITAAIGYMKEFVFQMEHYLVQREKQLFLSQPIINDHNFSYIHNPVDACSNSTDLLLVVPSAPTNFEKRQIARDENRGDYVRNATNNAKMLFFLGRPSPSNDSTQFQEQIDDESKTFGDIVQENFKDVYSNNRLKSVSMLKWASTYCPTTKYVIRTDDDINVDVTLLVSVLHRTAQTVNNFILGRKRVNDKPARELDNKYYLSLEEYPPPTFPPYLLGGLLGYPISTGKLLYEAALRVKPVWLEDIYITGLCAPKVHVPVITDPEFVFEHPYS